MPPARGLVHVFTNDPVGACATTLAARGFTVLSHAEIDALVDAFDTDRPTCVLIDYPEAEDALNMLRALGEKRLARRAILLVDHGDVRCAVTGMKLGAIDIVERPCDCDGLALLLAGQIRSGGSAEDVFQARALIAKLTRREAQVLALLREGKQNKAIAFSLGLSTRTVEMHRASLMRKLGVRTLSDALRIAFRAEADDGAQPARGNPNAFATIS